MKLLLSFKLALNDVIQNSKQGEMDQSSFGYGRSETFTLAANFEETTV